MMKRINVLISILLLCCSPTAFSHGGASGIVKERMDLMDNLKSAMKELKPIMRGKQEYSAEKVRQSAQLIQENAAEHMTKLFPKGSLEHPSEATPEIWEQWQEFEQIAKDLERLAKALYEGADKGIEKQGKGNHQGHMMGRQDSKHHQSMMGHHPPMHHDMMSSETNKSMPPISMAAEKMSDEQLAAIPPHALFRMIGKTCSSCHKKYREEK